MHRNVLIVSYDFPPVNNMGAKRYGIMCKYLQKNGYVPYILTVYPSFLNRLDIRLDLDVPVGEDQILRVGQSGMVYPIQDWKWTIICEYLKKRRLVSRIIEETSLGWYWKVVKEIDLYELKKKEIDIIIGTFPPSSNLLLARYLSKKLNIPYIVEVRDLISDYREHGKNEDRLVVLDSILERILLSSASGIISVTERFSDILKKRFPRKDITTIYNGWEHHVSDGQKSTPKRYMYYAGSLYEHRLESLLLLLECVATCDTKVPLIVRSIGPENLTKKAKRFCKKLQLEDRVKIMGGVSEKIVQMEQAMAWINVVFSSIHEKDKALMGTIPGKVFELLHGASPILAVVHESSEIADILQMTNKGLATTDKTKIKSFLQTDHETYIGNQNIEVFSREHQAKKLCSFLDKLLI